MNKSTPDGKRGTHDDHRSRMARPAPARFVSFISEYFRDSSTPGAPPSNAALTAAYTSSGVVFLLVRAVGMSTSMPGQTFTFDATPAIARRVSRRTYSA